MWTAKRYTSGRHLRYRAANASRSPAPIISISSSSDRDGWSDVPDVCFDTLLRYSVGEGKSSRAPRDCRAGEEDDEQFDLLAAWEQSKGPRRVNCASPRR